MSLVAPYSFSAAEPCGKVPAPSEYPKPEVVSRVSLLVARIQDEGALPVPDSKLAFCGAHIG